MAKQSKAPAPEVLGCGLDLAIEALRWQLHELKLKDDGKYDNPWRVLDQAARLLAAGDAEGAGHLVAFVTEKVTRLESIARANRVRSNRRERSDRQIMAAWKSRHSKTRGAFVMQLARQHKIAAGKPLLAFRKKVYLILRNHLGKVTRPPKP